MCSGSLKSYQSARIARERRGLYDLSRVIQVLYRYRYIWWVVQQLLHKPFSFFLPPTRAVSWHCVLRHFDFYYRHTFNLQYFGCYFFFRPESAHLDSWSKMFCGNRAGLWLTSLVHLAGRQSVPSFFMVQLSKTLPFDSIVSCTSFFCFFFITSSDTIESLINSEMTGRPSRISIPTSWIIYLCRSHGWWGFLCQ